MKLISIIIPYYKKKKYIQDTLKSIINQSYKRYEIIIIYDDQDLDEFYFLKKITKKNIKIKILKNKKQIGAGMSRNRGISISKESILHLLMLMICGKKKLKTQMNFMLKNKAYISHTSYEILDNNKIISSRKAKNFSN